MTMLPRITLGSFGLYIRTFECPGLRYYLDVVELADPMKSRKTTGWLHGELRAPTRRAAPDDAHMVVCDLNRMVRGCIWCTRVRDPRAVKAASLAAAICETTARPRQPLAASPRCPVGAMIGSRID